ncbi:MAG: iron-containing alcohol dehydrogenase [Coriobacteriales bacterium]|jgi:glycerol dehydrogenase|nr:iron-containing alcohol dehydrogenase [Coriobacteriales bacterium]
MAQIRTPRVYYAEPEALDKLGAFATTLGGRAYIVAGHNAWGVAGEKVTAQLAAEGIEWQQEEYASFPSEADARAIAERARLAKAEFIIGVGGGRALDVSKLAASYLGVFHIAVPTIAATCAAFAACVVLYDTEGAAVGFDLPDYSPIAVFADTAILAAAPLRYLKAGLADTLAKWYENLPNLLYSDSLLTHQQLNDAHLALDTIRKHAPVVLEQLKGATPEQAAEIGAGTPFKELVDTIILMAGLVGSITANTEYHGLAHPFYTGATYVPATRTYLHGERVSFGLFAQSVALKDSAELQEELLGLLSLLDQPVTFAQIGITEDLEQAAHTIAKNTLGAFSSFEVDGKVPSVEQLQAIYLETDLRGREYLKAHGTGEGAVS